MGFGGAPNVIFGFRKRLLGVVVGVEVRGNEIAYHAGGTAQGKEDTQNQKRRFRQG